MNITERTNSKKQVASLNKGERKKQDILDAAAELFFTKGYAATTVQDILDVLGCSKGSFYHGFESKLDVLTGIARQRALINYASFTALKPRDPLGAMNLLLYDASPLRMDEIGLVHSLATLAQDSEGAVLEDALREAAFLAFYQDFEKLAFELKQDEQACFGSADELKLAFHSFLSGCTLLIRESAGLPASKAAARGIPMLWALRRQIEGSLGILAGSLPITKSNELLDVMEYISVG